MFSYLIGFQILFLLLFLIKWNTRFFLVFLESKLKSKSNISTISKDIYYLYILYISFFDSIHCCQLIVRKGWSQELVTHLLRTGFQFVQPIKFQHYQTLHCDWLKIRHAGAPEKLRWPQLYIPWFKKLNIQCLICQWGWIYIFYLSNHRIFGAWYLIAKIL